MNILPSIYPPQKPIQRAHILPPPNTLPTCNHTHHGSHKHRQIELSPSPSTTRHFPSLIKEKNNTSMTHSTSLLTPLATDTVQNDQYHYTSIPTPKPSNQIPNLSMSYENDKPATKPTSTPVGSLAPRIEIEQSSNRIIFPATLPSALRHRPVERRPC